MIFFLKSFLIFFLFKSFLIKSLEIRNDIYTKKASIYYIKTTGKYKVVEGVYDLMATAYAKYTPSYEEKGWDFLTLSSYDGIDDKYSDEVKNYAMGYLEGVLTYKRIYPAYYNLNNYKYYKNKGVMPNSTYEFFQKNLQFINNMTSIYKDIDSYWHEVNNLYNQMRGLHDGYNSMAPPYEKIDLVHFQTVVSLGDVDEIANWKEENRPDFSKMTTDELIEYLGLHNHCSAFFKVADDLSDVWFGHNTWTTYNKLIRIFKEYKYIPNSAFPIKAKTITMSSYPAAVNSQDDFYITDANLYVGETTNSVHNLTLFDLLDPSNTLMCWMRTMVANRLADDGYSWIKIFSKYNSGTYNNQFQILDLKLIDTKNKKMSPGAFYIVEQLPGSCDFQDVTDNLKKGYWPSYNTPFLMSVREKSGIIDAINQNPNLTISEDYDTCARAKIFRREQSKVKDIETYKNLIRYNNYSIDEFSEGKPSNTIAARYDLNRERPLCYGATDAKFASINEIKNSEKKIVHIIAGPTTNNEQPPFIWSKAPCRLVDEIRFKVIGQVDEYNFDWIDYEISLW